jgi:hypothetical protein
MMISAMEQTRFGHQDAGVGVRGLVARAGTDVAPLVAQYPLLPTNRFDSALGWGVSLVALGLVDSRNYGQEDLKRLARPVDLAGQTDCVADSGFAIASHCN